ncbi:MAG: hypothetical protein RR791_06905 [Lachnospiraceae bacterium]
MDEQVKQGEIETGNGKHLDEETLFVVSQTFKALSDPTRIRILNLWMIELMLKWPYVFIK